MAPLFISGGSIKQFNHGEEGQFHSSLKREFPHDLEIPPLGIYPNVLKVNIHIKIYT